MNVYTYYQEINFSKQKPLLELWQKSWKDKGFNPIVLNEEDANSHPYYKEFSEKLNKLHIEVTGQELKAYGLSCYLRWLAYANKMNENESAYVCDYDVINKGLSDTELDDSKMFLYDNCCPCFASGTKDHFLKFCQDIVEITESNADSIKANIANGHWYHDQEFIVYNEKILKTKDYIHLDGRHPSERKIQEYKHRDYNLLKSKVIHFSHGSIDKARDNFPNYKSIELDQLRIDFVKKILKIK